MVETFNSLLMADFFPMFTVLFNNQTILVHGAYKNTDHTVFNGGLFFVDPPQQTTFSEYFTRVFLGKFSFSFQLLFKHRNPLTLRLLMSYIYMTLVA